MAKKKATRKKKAGRKSLIPEARIEQSILLLREQKVMLDTDLAELYEVETGALVRQMKRNIERFPADFMFQLNKPEWEDLKCQIGIASWGGRRSPPYAFTEQGVAMLSSVLRSPRAVEVNIEIVRTFVRLRELLATHKDLAQKLEKLEKSYDENFRIIFDAIRQLMQPPPGKSKRKIGFR